MRGRGNWLLLLLGLTLVRGLAYAAIVPPWQAPDENGHFEYAWRVAYLERLPTPADVSAALERELIGSLYEWRYGEFIGRPLAERMPVQMNDLPANIFAVWSRSALERFSLAYIWAAFFVWPFLHQDLVVQLYAARLASVLLELGVVWLAWCIFREVMPHQPGLVMAMTAFVVFLPQHTFINAGVNEGPLAELCACIVLYGWLRLLGGPVRARHVAAVLGGTLIGLWTKNTAAFLLPLDVVMLAFSLIARWRARTQRLRPAYLGLAVLTLVVLLGGATWHAPPWRLVSTALRQWASAPRFYLENGQTSLDQALWQTFDSFWAQFGWMNVRAGRGWYILVYILTAWAIEGWLIPRSRSWVAPTYAMRLLGTALLLAVSVWLIYALITPAGLGYSQGRYLFPVTVPVAFFLVGGWARSVPAHWRRYFAPGAVVLLAMLDAAAVCLVLWPYFYR